jgi:hypothetical protein
MRQELDPEYDIAVNNMLPFEGDAPKGWEVEKAEFISTKGKAVKMNVLRKEEVGSKDHLTQSVQQIFQMKDGKFILEVDDFEEIEYFCSNDLADLL